MATSEENVFYANGIVRSKENDSLRCLLCMREDNFTHWQSHIVSTRHVGTLQQFNLIFLQNGDRVYCKACGANIIWEFLKSHANWHRVLPWYEPEDKDKLLFENYIMVWEALKMYYYCFPCAAIFSEWSDIFAHLTDERHQNFIKPKLQITACFSLADTTFSYKILASEGFQPCGPSKVTCTVCNVVNIEFPNITQHIETNSHLIAKLQLMRALEIRENQQVQRQVEKCRENSICKETQNKEQVNPTRDSLQYSNNQNNMPIPLNGRDTLQKKIQDKNCTLRRNFNGHKEMKNNTGKSRVPDSNNFQIQQRGAERYCTICECILDTTDVCHLTGDEHLAALRRYGYEHIVSKDSTRFDCKSCNCVVPNLENVFRHIKGSRHINSLPTQKNVTDRQAAPRGKTISFKINLPKPTDNLTKSSWGNLPPDYIVQQNPRDLFCRICDCVIYGHNNAHDHIRSKIHANSVEQFSATIVTRGLDAYFCKRCDCEILGRDNLYLHIHTGKHANSVLARQALPASNSIAVKDAQILENRELPASNLNSFTEIWKQLENPSEKNQNYEFIIKLNNTDFCCKICRCVLFDQTTINKHVAEERHVNASRNYNCNDPSSSENVKYFCNSCRCNIPNLANVYLHTVGGRHKNSLPYNSTLRPPSRSKFDPNSQMLALDYIAQLSDSDYNCKICNVSWSDQSNVEAHIVDKTHIAALKKYGCENIFHMEGNKYRCNWCNCVIPSLDNIYVHVAGKKHLQFVAEKQQTMPPINNTSEVSKIPKLLELATFPPSSLVNSSQEKPKVKESKNPANDQISSKEHQDTREETLCTPSVASTLEPQVCSTDNSDEKLLDLDRYQKLIEKMVAEAVERDLVARSTTNSVINQKLSDFLNDGRKISSQTYHDGLSLNNSPRHTNNSSSGTKLMENKRLKIGNETILTLNDDGASFRSLASSTLSLNENGKPVRKRRAPKKENAEKKLQILDFDNDYIYDMRDKLREIERGMKLCLTTDFNNIYCLICHKKTANTLHNYCEHLWSLDHCEFLESMEKDHALFEVVPGQFSELDLSSHYMEESSEDTIFCYVCNKEMDNIDNLLQDHTNDKMHVEKCEEIRSRAGENFQAIQSRILCDWYKIYKYWCVPCSMKFESELIFAKHLKSTGHSSVVNNTENTEKTLFYDFCAPCALLWYGYRFTYINHCEVPPHKWLLRDESFLSPQLPTSAKCLLAMPEEYIKDTMQYFDEILAKEREKQDTLIHDIEKVAKCKFPDAKAYVFGSRVAGLDSMNSDIEIFLDCGDMYDGKDSSQDQISCVKTVMSDALSKDPKLWDMEELSTKCQTTIKTRHRATGLACDIHFENGLSVERTKLITTYNDVYPSCRKMIIFLKEWLEFCGLPASEFITINTLCWCVIFYLQHISIVPNIAELIEVKEEYHIIAGWEVGVSHDFTSSQTHLTIKDLLIRFFTFYANFDYRYNVICPLIGEKMKKRVFANPQSLPKEMKPYIEYMKNSNNPEPFRFDTAMCIQDPFCLQENLTKAVSKVNLSRFRTYCFKSLDILDSPSSSQ